MNEVKAAIAAARARVVAVAAGQIGAKDASAFWTVCGREPYNPRLAWCGIFALWCLREAGIAPPDLTWEFGVGFLSKLPRTNDPQPGDIGYLHLPFQHHLIVEATYPHTSDGTMVHSIDGNQPTVARRVRPLNAITAFYSIEDLVIAAHAREAYPDHSDPPRNS